MPTAAERRPDVLVDTSVAVALVVADHDAHDATVEALRDQHLGLSGHAWFETLSVLTRLPPPARRRPGEVVRLLDHEFAASRFLDPRSQHGLGSELGALGIAGGAVYDALVGAAAREHRVPLATRDRRAADVYRALQVTTRLLGG